MVGSDHKIPTLLLLLPLIFFLSLSSLVSGSTTTNGSKLQTYIINVQRPEKDASTFSTAERDRWYKSFLPKSSTGGGDIDNRPRLVYPYSEVFSGFAAKLTVEELKAMEKMKGFVKAFPDKELHVTTTHSPEFLGLKPGQGLWQEAPPGLGEGVIIGVLDTGITPGHPSFRDAGMPLPPRRWRGRCTPPVVCNNKLIGAKAFGSIRSPVDENDHGTHTSGTAAGAFVDGANDAFGNAGGTAAGIAPRAHLAVYKVCYSDTCIMSDVLAGMDAAVKDGVDVMSISLGGPTQPYYDDPMAIGAFAATRKGIFVSSSAGNDGANDISNEAPWFLTVAASTIDRNIRAIVRLGDGREFNGESLFQPNNFSPTLLPVVYGENCDSSFQVDVRGKVVLCEVGEWNGRVDKGSVVKDAGAAAMVLMNSQTMGYTTIADPHVLPASEVSYADGITIKDYVSKPNPKATILFKGTVISNNITAPDVAFFSSKGPSRQSPGVMKPDITGPGVNILAAWTEPPSSFNIISGTSMSTPHLSGIAALLKALHPNWSPAAIKSAIMTTSNVHNNKGGAIKNELNAPATFFEMGAGHVNPSTASNPGLVFDTVSEDYIPFLCGLGYTDEQMTSTVGSRVRCSSAGRIEEWDLNYPSMTVSGRKLPLTLKRTVTNVGGMREEYKVEVDAPPGVSVGVEPQILDFTALMQKKSFMVTFKNIGNQKSAEAAAGAESVWPDQPKWVFGNLKWVSNEHVVRSPIAVAL